MYLHPSNKPWWTGKLKRLRWRRFTGMEGEADAEVKGTPAMSVGLNTLPRESLTSSNQRVEVQDFQQLLLWDGLDQFPHRLRRKERKAILLKLQHSTRQESSLTFPPGFSIRGLLRHAAARLQYTGVHRCSCGTEDRGFRLWGALLLGGAHSLPQNCLQH